MLACPAASAEPSGIESCWPSFGTFVAERGRPEFCASSPVRKRAQSCAHLESPRARVPSMAGREISLATALRGSARTTYWRRFLGAYGSHRLKAKAPHRTARMRSSAPPSNRSRYIDLHTTAISVAGKISRHICRLVKRASICSTPTRTLNPFGWLLQIEPDANVLPRHRCAPVRGLNAPSVSQALMAAATVGQKRKRPVLSTPTGLVTTKSTSRPLR